jgi:hypothetical protein
MSGDAEHKYIHNFYSTDQTEDFLVNTEEPQTGGFFSFFGFTSTQVTSVGYREKVLASVLVGAKIKSIIYSEQAGYLVIGLQSGTIHVYIMTVSGLL